MKLLRLLMVVSVICFYTPNLNAGLFTWTDENGVKHYSNTAPSKDVEGIEEIPESQSDETIIKKRGREFDKKNVKKQSKKIKKKVDDPGQKNKSLRAAATNGRLEDVKRLLGEGADINASADSGMTPLILASWMGRTEVVELLLGEGADVAAKTKLGSTALTLANERNHKQVIALLRQYGAAE